MSNRAEQDDKLVALFAAFEAYKLGGKHAAACKKLKEIVAGNQELEAHLEKFLHPPKRKDEIAAYERRSRRQSRERAKQEDANRGKWRSAILANISKIRDPGLTDTDVISQLQWCLYERMQEKIARKGKWTAGAWRSLIPEFGEEAAKAFRDGAILHWRRVTPKLRSEGAEANSETASTIFGLTGLAIEARETADWAKNLGPDDVLRAARFALHELNGFPEWFPALFVAYPVILADLLMTEVIYEVHAEPDAGMHYVISDLAYSGKWAWAELGPRILELLKTTEPRNSDTLDKLLRIVIKSDILGADIGSLAKQKLTSGNDLRHAVNWFAVWTSIEPEEAISAFAERLEKCPENQKSVGEAMNYAIHLLGNQYNSFPISRSAFKQPRFLKELYVLLHRYIRRSEDTDPPSGESYSPTVRDHAQDARNRIFNLLNEIPGQEAYDVMMEIAQTESNPNARKWIEYQAHQKAERDGNMAPWTAAQVCQFNEKQERAPANHRELGELVVSRILDLKHDFEEGDSSPAATLMRVDAETEMRTFLGRELREKAAGRYVIPQEEELADGKRPDMRVHGNGFDGPIPIELKLADKKWWTGPQLFERLENQLAGDYLRDLRSSRGVFLLVHQGKKGEWELPDKSRVDFDGLVAALQKHWRELSPRYPNVEEIAVIGIDLTKRFK